MSKRIVFYTPDNTAASLDREAKRRKISLSSVVNERIAPENADPDNARPLAEIVRTTVKGMNRASDNTAMLIAMLDGLAAELLGNQYAAWKAQVAAALADTPSLRMVV